MSYDANMHWMPADFTTEEWPDNPVKDPVAAARMLLEAQKRDCDAAWEAWDDLQCGGYVWVRLCGWVPTTELIEDEASQFDGYEPGQKWFKRTEYELSVMVTLSFDVREPAKTTTPGISEGEEQ